VVAGRACSAYPAVGPDVKIAGGKFVDIPVDKAHVDGNLVTAPAWPAHPEWLAKFLKCWEPRLSYRKGRMAFNMEVSGPSELLTKKDEETA